jgi:urease accessory protein
MIRATEVRAAYRWTEPPADTVVLDFDDRHRRRMAMTGTRGLEFLLDLEKAVVGVAASPNPLAEIRGGDPQHLVRLAWHLGNRHLPTQIMPRALRIRRDHVIESMVKGLGARVIEIEAPFDPEGGAYAGLGHADASQGYSDHHATHDHSSHDHGGQHHHHEHCDHDHHDGHHHAHDHK